MLTTRRSRNRHSDRVRLRLPHYLRTNNLRAKQYGSSPKCVVQSLGMLFGGMIPETKSFTGNQSSVQHLKRITDDTKATFYWDVAGVKPTTDYVCTATEMEEVKCLKCARTTEIDYVYQYVFHSGTIPAQRTRSKRTLVPRNVSLVSFETESTHCEDDYRTTQLSQPPTTECESPSRISE